MDETTTIFLKELSTTFTTNNTIQTTTITTNTDASSSSSSRMVNNISIIENDFFTQSIRNSTANGTEFNFDEEENKYLRVYPALSQYKGIIDDAYIQRINTFWLQFEPSSTSTHYTIAIIYIIITVIGCCGNALVVFMFIRCKSLRTPANILVINLAISDFFMVAKGPIAIYNSLHFGPALGDLGCRIYGFIGGLTGTASIMTLTAISIDRYHVVVYPLDPIHSTTKRRSIIMLTIVWLYSFVFSIIPALDIGLSHYVPEGLLTTCGFDYLSKSSKAQTFMIVFFVAAWCIPFTTITYCYFYILKIVIKANSIQSSKDRNKTELKLATTVIIIICLWFLAWTPYSVVALLGISGNEKLITPISSMVPAIFCKTSACIDPYVYAVTHPRFKMEFGRVFLGKSVHRMPTYRSSVTRFSRTRISTSRQLYEISIIPDRRNTRVKMNSENMGCGAGGSRTRSSSLNIIEGNKFLERRKSLKTTQHNEERF